MPKAQSPDRQLTWTILLAQATQLAKAAVALPDDDEGGRWKQAVPSIITLHAVIQSLDDIDLLDEDEQSVGIDKAEILIRRSTAEIHDAWRSEPLPSSLAELIGEARDAFDALLNRGLEWTVSSDVLLTGHPGDLALALVEAGFEGDLYLPTPGVPLFATSPAAYLMGPAGLLPDEQIAAAVDAFLASGGTCDDPVPHTAMRQVYRQFDFSKGGPVRDLVVPLTDDLPPGQPLLVPVIHEGAICPVTLPPRAPTILKPIPVEFQDT